MVYAWVSFGESNSEHAKARLIYETKVGQKHLTTTPRRSEKSFEFSRSEEN
jgi:hypothetical protein